MPRLQMGRPARLRNLGQTVAMETPNSWSSFADGRAAATALVPEAARALLALEAAAWHEADAGLAALAARVCAQQLGIPPMLPPPGIAAPSTVSVEAERAATAFAQQFTVDVSGIDDPLRGELGAQLGEATLPFAQVVYVVDITPRAWLLLDKLFGSPSGPPEAVDVVPYSDAFEVMLKEIAKLDALDAITTELVRLRGARQHECRICKSRRSRTAILAGADESTFEAVDFYETSDLPERIKTALRLTDAFIWQPGYVSDALLAEVRAAFTPREAVELVLDLARNSANKVAVAFAADGAVVTEGIELYEIDDNGELFAGMSL
jgi:alkylhydroperoxidase family enzyme